MAEPGSSYPESCVSSRQGTALGTGCLLLSESKHQRGDWRETPANPSPAPHSQTAHSRAIPTAAGIFFPCALTQLVSERLCLRLVVAGTQKSSSRLDLLFGAQPSHSSISGELPFSYLGIWA